MTRKVQVWIALSESQKAVKKVLILKTKPERGGFWQPITGGVDANESLEAAALREASEETGLKLEVLGQIKATGVDFEFQSRWGDQGRVKESVFLITLTEKPSKIVLDPKEHIECQWVTPERAIDMIKFESNKDALRQILKGLQ